jgi:hypothetical protein
MNGGLSTETIVAHMLQTTAPPLDSGCGRIKKGFFWAIACGD